VQYFPTHTHYIELFFGAGGLFFNKPMVKHNFLNDNDSDVFNLFQVLTTRFDELYELCELMPIHNDLFQHWRHNKETDSVRAAARFLMHSNFGYMGMPDALRVIDQHGKKNLLKKAKQTFDFRDVLKKLAFEPNNKTLENTLIYADPPYLETGNNYQKGGFTEQDTTDLFNVCLNSNFKFAISEFKHPFILDLAAKHNLTVIDIGERKSLKNRSTEILVINYPHNSQSKLF
jgi:DNA adenine methylase